MEVSDVSCSCCLLRMVFARFRSGVEPSSVEIALRRGLDGTELFPLPEVTVIRRVVGKAVVSGEILGGGKGPGMWMGMGIGMETLREDVVVAE